MIIKNRKLVPREGKDVSAFNVAEIERMISEVSDGAWHDDAGSEREIEVLFTWHATPQGGSFWDAVNDAFAVEPVVTPEAERASLISTIVTAKATIAEAEKALAELGE